MAYIPIQSVSDEFPETKKFVHNVLDGEWFHAVHVMLRFPMKDAGIGTRCTFALGHMLVTAAAGISTTLFKPNRTDDGKVFKKFIRDIYPWHLESEQSLERRQDIAKLIYDEFRNPITHELGFISAKRRKKRDIQFRDRSIKMKRTAKAHSEDEIELIERSGQWPLKIFESTIVVKPYKVVLNCERFYFGLRHATQALLQDSARMQRAERYLSKADLDDTDGETDTQ